MGTITRAVPPCRHRHQTAQTGKPLTPKSKYLYYVLHKPVGVVVTKKDPEGRKTVYQLIHHLDSSVNSVGRLDQDSEGLLLLTNDGDLAFRLAHPSYEVEKVYHVLLNRLPSAGEIQKLKEGVSLEEGRTSPAEVRVIQKTEEIWVEIQIHEGKKRQVRRMFETVGCKVKRLIRVKIGPLELEDLPMGRWRQLTFQEAITLRKLVGLS